MTNYYQTKIALGGEVILNLVSDLTEDEINPIFKDLWGIITKFENTFSRFKANSELSRFNQSAGTKQYISPEFEEVLIQVKKYIKLTDGLFNPFILPALQSAGYKKSFVDETIPADYSNRAVVAGTSLKTGKDWAQIPYGTAIDLGGIGKGYLADKLSIALKGKQLKGYWLSLGGDIVTSGKDVNNKNWSVDIQDSENMEDVLGHIKLPTDSNFGIATSGVIKRRGEHKGRSWHHIIDPRTNLPAETDVLVATVCANSSLEADILATCAVILGSAKAIDFLKKNNVESALIQSKKDDSKVILKKLGNLIELDE